MIAPISPSVPACYGLLCTRHGQCQRYAAVETTSPDHTQATCHDGKGGWPMFVALQLPEESANAAA